MSHKYFQQLLSSYLDNELSADEKLQIERHVEGCDECKQRLQIFHTVKSHIHAGGNFELSGNFTQSVVRRIRQEQEGAVLWLGPEVFARRLILGLFIVVSCLVGLGSLFQPEQTVTMDRYLRAEHQDSVSIQVLTPQSEISKDDILYAAMSK
ncbi:MAG: zf-HC2 domain-containing protein [Ignavibacteriales bacterium]|nr:zf-HC2 domain-containing protein [Ignavibacteriales bacterium]